MNERVILQINLESDLCLNIDKAEYEDDATVYGSIQLYECK